MRRWLALTAVLMVAACGGDAQESVTTVGGSTLGGSPTSVATTTTLIAAEYPPLLPDMAVPVITQITPTEGGGFRPVLEWTAVEGASLYLVAVQAPDGRLYWAWRTEDTSVPVGGLPRLEEDAFGPAVSRGMTWSVIALDTDGAVVGASAVRPIAP